MNAHYTYLFIDVLTLAFPLLLSFDKKVAFYKTWTQLWRGMLLTGAFFIEWDIVFTQRGVWSFNNNYIIGYRIGGLPIEEWLFFIVVPYACSFIYSCIMAYVPLQKRRDNGWKVLLPLGILLIIFGALFWTRAYTCTSFCFCGMAILLVNMFQQKLPAFRADAFLYTFFISILPFLVVNGLLTAIPIVRYNNFHNLGIRIFTIPFEDNFYGMLLMLGNIVALSPPSEK